MTAEQQTNMTARLIGAFVVAMLAATALEFLISHLVTPLFASNLILPLMGQTGVSGMTVWQSIYLFLGLIFLLPIHLVGSIRLLQDPLVNFEDQILDVIAKQVFGPPKGGPLPGLTGGEIALLLLGLSLVLLLYALPYIITGLLYARFVIGQMRILQEAQRREHEQFDANRNLIFSDIAHDLRNPITTISGYAKALSDGMVTDPLMVRRYLKAIEAKSRRVNDLVNLLFDYAKIHSTGFRLQKSPQDINELVRENTALLYEEVEARGMDLQVQISEERWEIMADPIQLSRVISNLINNAGRHNPRGTKILVKTQAVRREEGEQSYEKMRREGVRPTEANPLLEEGILVIVADTGSPIPGGLAAELFEPFSTGDAARSSQGGSGLGLSIAAKISQMHGYRLTLEENDPAYTKAFVLAIPKRW